MHEMDMCCSLGTVDPKPDPSGPGQNRRCCTCSSILVMISLVCSLTMSGSSSSNMAAMLEMKPSGSCTQHFRSDQGDAGQSQ